MAGLEPAFSTFRKWRALQLPHIAFQSGSPDLNRHSPAPQAGGLAKFSQIPIESTQRDLNPHIRLGKAAGCHYIMGASVVAVLSKSEPISGTRGTRTLPITSPTRVCWSSDSAIGAGGSRTPTPSVKSRVRYRLRHGPALLVVNHNGIVQRKRPGVTQDAWPFATDAEDSSSVTSAADGRPDNSPADRRYCRSFSIPIDRTSTNNS